MESLLWYSTITPIRFQHQPIRCSYTQERKREESKGEGKGEETVYIAESGELNELERA